MDQSKRNTQYEKSELSPSVNIGMSSHATMLKILVSWIVLALLSPTCKAVLNPGPPQEHGLYARRPLHEGKAQKGAAKGKFNKSKASKPDIKLVTVELSKPPKEKRPGMKAEKYEVSMLEKDKTPDKKSGISHNKTAAIKSGKPANFVLVRDDNDDRSMQENADNGYIEELYRSVIKSTFAKPSLRMKKLFDLYGPAFKIFSALLREDKALVVRILNMVNERQYENIKDIIESSRSEFRVGLYVILRILAVADRRHAMDAALEPSRYAPPNISNILVKASLLGDNLKAFRQYLPKFGRRKVPKQESKAYVLVSDIFEFVDNVRPYIEALIEFEKKVTILGALLRYLVKTKITAKIIANTERTLNLLAEDANFLPYMLERCSHSMQDFVRKWAAERLNLAGKPPKQILILPLQQKQHENLQDDEENLEPSDDSGEDEDLASALGPDDELPENIQETFTMYEPEELSDATHLPSKLSEKEEEEEEVLSEAQKIQRTHDFDQDAAKRLKESEFMEPEEDELESIFHGRPIEVPYPIQNEGRDSGPHSEHYGEGSENSFHGPPIDIPIGVEESNGKSKDIAEDEHIPASSEVSETEHRPEEGKKDTLQEKPQEKEEILGTLVEYQQEEILKTSEHDGEVKSDVGDLLAENDLVVNAEPVTSFTQPSQVNFEAEFSNNPDEATEAIHSPPSKSSEKEEEGGKREEMLNAEQGFQQTPSFGDDTSERLKGGEMQPPKEDEFKGIFHGEYNKIPHSIEVQETEQPSERHVEVSGKPLESHLYFIIDPVAVDESDLKKDIAEQEHIPESSEMPETARKPKDEKHEVLQERMREKEENLEVPMEDEHEEILKNTEHDTKVKSHEGDLLVEDTSPPLASTVVSQPATISANSEEYSGENEESYEALRAVSQQSETFQSEYVGPWAGYEMLCVDENGSSEYLEAKKVESDFAQDNDKSPAGPNDENGFSESLEDKQVESDFAQVTDKSPIGPNDEESLISDETAPTYNEASSPSSGPKFVYEEFIDKQKLSEFHPEEPFILDVNVLESIPEDIFANASPNVLENLRFEVDSDYAGCVEKINSFFESGSGKQMLFNIGKEQQNAEVSACEGLGNLFKYLPSDSLDAISPECVILTRPEYFKELEPEKVNAFKPDVYENLLADQVKSMKPTTFAHLDTDHLKNMSKTIEKVDEKLVPLTGCAGITGSHLEALPSFKGLSVKCLQAVGIQEIARLAKESFAKLPVEYFAKLTFSALESSSEPDSQRLFFQKMTLPQFKHLLKFYRKNAESPFNGLDMNWAELGNGIDQKRITSLISVQAFSLISEKMIANLPTGYFDYLSRDIQKALTPDQFQIVPVQAFTAKNLLALAFDNTSLCAHFGLRHLYHMHDQDSRSIDKLPVACINLLSQDAWNFVMASARHLNSKILSLESGDHLEDLSWLATSNNGLKVEHWRHLSVKIKDSKNMACTNIRYIDVKAGSVATDAFWKGIRPTCLASLSFLDDLEKDEIELISKETLSSVPKEVKNLLSAKLERKIEGEIWSFEAILQMSDEEVSKITPKMFSEIPRDVLDELDSEVAQRLPKNILEEFKADQVTILRPEFLSGLSKQHFMALPPSSCQGFTAAQASNLPIEDLHRHCYTNLPPPVFAKLSLEDLRRIPDKVWQSSISRNQIMFILPKVLSGFDRLPEIGAKFDPESKAHPCLGITEEHTKMMDSHTKKIFLRHCKPVLDSQEFARRKLDL